MKKRKKKLKDKKKLILKRFKKHNGWEIVRLPNGDFQWIVRRGV